MAKYSIQNQTEPCVRLSKKRKLFDCCGSAMKNTSFIGISTSRMGDLLIDLIIYLCRIGFNS